MSGLSSHACNREARTHQVVFAVEGLNITNGLSDDLLLVEPDFGVSAGLRLETVRKLLGEVVNLLVKLAERGVRRTHLTGARGLVRTETNFEGGLVRHSRPCG